MSGLRSKRRIQFCKTHKINVGRQSSTKVCARVAIFACCYTQHVVAVSGIGQVLWAVNVTDRLLQDLQESWKQSGNELTCSQPTTVDGLLSSKAELFVQGTDSINGLIEKPVENSGNRDKIANADVGHVGDSTEHAEHLIEHGQAVSQIVRVLLLR